MPLWDLNGFAVVTITLVSNHQLKLEPDNKDGVKYIITTCMDPWSTSMEFVDDLAAVMRNTILNAIGTVSMTKDSVIVFCEVTLPKKKVVMIGCQLRMRYTYRSSGGTQTKRVIFLGLRDTSTISCTNILTRYSCWK